MLDISKQNYIDWNVKSVIKILDRDKYAYRIVLRYADGKTYTQQKSGFCTRKEAESARKQTIGELVNGTYIVNSNVRVDEFLTYWLEYDIRQRAGSFDTYKNYEQMVRLHILPFWRKKKLIDITMGDVQRLFSNRVAYSPNIARQVKVVLNVSFTFALTHKLVKVNPVVGVTIPKIEKNTAYHTRTIDTTKTLTLDQVRCLIEESKNTPIHMQILFNVLMGLRRKEINGLKYSDVDYINRTLSVERQLGKALDRTPGSDNSNMSAKSELKLKTESSKRILPIPDYVFEAILEERKKYEKNRNKRKNDKTNPFFDGDFICCSTYGKPRSKDFHWQHYKKLLRDLNLPDIRWHDLRSTFCTLLLKENFSPKAVSKLMGHAKEIITLDVYADNKNIIADAIPEIVAYMEEVMPETAKEENGVVIDTMIDITTYLT